MLPAAVVDATLDQLVDLLEPGDTVIDGGNSYYRDDIDPGRTRLAPKGIHYVDVGHQRRRLGTRARLLPDDRRRDRGRDAARPDLQDARAGRRLPSPRPGRRRADGTAQQGYLHCGPKRRRAFREDGAQRDRVRHDGRRSPRA